MALSSDQTPNPSNHRKTSLSVKSLPPMLPTPSYLNLPPHRAELPELKTTDTQSYQNKVLYALDSGDCLSKRSPVIPAWFTGKPILRISKWFLCGLASATQLRLLTPPTKWLAEGRLGLNLKSLLGLGFERKLQLGTGQFSGNWSMRSGNT